MVQDSRRDNWSRLTALLAQCETRGLQALSPEQLRELSHLYRAASGDLSLARAQGREDLAGYLNQLVARAHSQVYSRRTDRRPRLGHFFGAVVPRTFRRCRPFWLCSLAILVAGGTLGYVATRANPAWAEIFVSPGMRTVLEEFVHEQSPAGAYFAGGAASLGGSGLSGYLMTNNIQVALLCFAAGISFGLGTFYILARNAVMLGSVLGLGAYYGKLTLLAAVVAPHGVVELSAVVIAGAGGLRLGYALIDPGDYSRRDALVLAAREAGRLVLGTIPMFIFAGLVEGLISPVATGALRSEAVRLAFGALSGVVLYAWLFLGSAAAPDEDDEGDL